MPRYSDMKEVVTALMHLKHPDLKQANYRKLNLIWSLITQITEMLEETIPEVKIPWLFFCIKKCAVMCPCVCQLPCLNVSTSHGPVILIIWISLLVWFQWTHNKLGLIKQMSKHRFTFSLVQANPPDDVMKISLHLSLSPWDVKIIW